MPTCTVQTWWNFNLPVQIGTYSDTKFAPSILWKGTKYVTESFYRWPFVKIFGHNFFARVWQQLGNFFCLYIWKSLISIHHCLIHHMIQCSPVEEKTASPIKYYNILFKVIYSIVVVTIGGKKCSYMNLSLFWAFYRLKIPLNTLKSSNRSFINIIMALQYQFCYHDSCQFLRNKNKPYRVCLFFNFGSNLFFSFYFGWSCCTQSLRKIYLIYILIYFFRR